LNFFKTIARTPLFKVASLNGVSVILKIAIGVITSKVLAVFIGPSGLALTGNLKNFLTSVESIATLGFQNGIVKYVVEAKEDRLALKKILSTIFISLFAVSLALSFILFGFSSYFTSLIFGFQSTYNLIFKILAIVLPWYASTAYLLVILNGLGKFKKVIYVNIIGNIIGLLFCIVAVYYYATFGALVAIIVPPALLFFVAFYYVDKEISFFSNISRGSFDWSVLKNLSSYSLMALVSSVFGSFVFLAIRNNIITVLGLESAGYWEAMTRISTYYLMFISTILSVYFFPKLAFSTSKKAVQNVVKSYYFGVLPFFVIGAVVLFFFRFFLIKALFSKDFIPVADLFLWQLIGDAFKVASLILGYQFYAKKLTSAFIVTELFSLAIMFAFSHFFVISYGLVGVVIAHALTYFIYFIVLLLYFRRSLF
jgi:O-antigen/teichoic acid export membrane protein